MLLLLFEFSLLICDLRQLLTKKDILHGIVKISLNFETILNFSKKTEEAINYLIGRLSDKKNNMGYKIGLQVKFSGGYRQDTPKKMCYSRNTNSTSFSFRSVILWEKRTRDDRHFGYYTTQRYTSPSGKTSELWEGVNVAATREMAVKPCIVFDATKDNYEKVNRLVEALDSLLYLIAADMSVLGEDDLEVWTFGMLSLVDTVTNSKK